MNAVKLSVHKKPIKKIGKRKRVKWAKTDFHKVSTDEEGNDGDES